MLFKLAHHIRQTVADKFGVYLQPEVRFMGANGEVNSEQVHQLIYRGKQS